MPLVSLLLSAALALSSSSYLKGATADAPVVKSAPAPAPEEGAVTPTAWCVYPSNARPLDPVIVFGTDFDLGALAFFGSVPSVPIFVFAAPDSSPVPFAFMVVPVPPALLGGSAPLSIEYLGQRSNREPFRVRLLGNGYQQGPDPELWCSQPEAASIFEPVALFGFDFTEESVPYFGLIPSVNLGSFTNPIVVPPFGTFSAMITVVPPSFPGNVQVNVRRGGDRTESIPFRIRG